MDRHWRSKSDRGGLLPHLQILEGERVVFTYPLGPGRTVVGRSDAADVALPSDTVSREHCALEARSSGWWFTDHSRHGTRVDGVLMREGPVGMGAVLEVGAYRIRLAERAVDEAHPTMTRVLTPADHEELVDVAKGGVIRRAELRVLEGPRKGEEHVLNRPRVRVGGPGAHVVLDGQMPPDAAVLRVVRGRVVVEPGTRPVFLEGQRVRVPTPVFDGELVRIGEHGVELRSRVLAESVAPATEFGSMVGSSSVMQRLYATLERVARHDATVLLLGETGTGKELAARGLHDSSARQDRAFVAVNCASIPSTLVESELFGHEAGAFTGAAKRQDGAFQRAEGGTLFLDELGEMSPDVQAKLLRALESGEVRRVGGKAPEFPDVRVVAATHRDLGRLADQGSFRRDLLYRLAVLTVTIPPLRSHAEDVPEVARALLARHHPGARIEDGALTLLAEHPWPGNVRELRNVLTRAVVLYGPVVRREHLTFDPWSAPPEAAAMGMDAEASERVRVEAALARARGNRAEAARELGLPRTSLLYRMRRLGLA